MAAKRKVVCRATPSLGVNAKIDVYLLAGVELADGLGVTLVAIKLGVDFIVDIGREGGDVIGAVLRRDIGFYGAGAGVGEVNDGRRQGIVLTINDSAGEHLGGV